MLLPLTSRTTSLQPSVDSSAHGAADLHIYIHVQRSLKLYPGRCCPLSDFMMKVNN